MQNLILMQQSFDFDFSYHCMIKLQLHVWRKYGKDKKHINRCFSVYDKKSDKMPT